ncbi:MAG: FkbM family methyltransferase, partial [Bryobacteraceae bacterium]|nr:FkbM family methyltransferase [Bryobacteraceae bacterium]
LAHFCNTLAVEDISLLKTDTEGFDLDVLQGAESLLSAGRVFLVLVEVGFSDQDAGHTSFSAVRQLLEDFDVIGFYDQGSDANSSGLDRADVLFIHRVLAGRHLPRRWA